MAIQVDIKKAFDILSWMFLLLELQRFVFKHVFCDWIFSILHFSRLYILVNGNVIGYFPCQ